MINLPRPCPAVLTDQDGQPEHRAGDHAQHEGLAREQQAPEAGHHELGGDDRRAGSGQRQ
jgi:hypothetical protein